MADRLIKTETLQGISDAIKAKRGITGSIPVPNFASEIAQIETGIDCEVFNPSDVTVEGGAIFLDDYTEGYNEGERVGHDAGVAEMQGAIEAARQEGKAEGITEGTTAGIEQGKQSARTAWWNKYQDGGKRTDYGTAYAGVGWDNENFTPMFDMQPTDSYMMFRNSRISGDLVEILSNLGRTLDFSKVTNALNTFTSSTKLTRIGVVNLSSVANASSANGMFNYCSKLETIDEIVLPESRVNFTDAFLSCTSLANVTFSGGKIQYNIDFKSCPLTRASIESVMGAIGTGTYTVTFKKSAVDAAFETSEGANDGSASAEWTALKDAHKSWTISLM